MTSPRRVILDTDIGTDVDDAMALAQLLGTPSVDLVAITTVYGDVDLRARLARRLCALAGREVPVHVGLGDTLSGREVWWAGHEGALLPGLESEPVDGDDAVGHLIDVVMAAPGTIDVIAIGPLTNVAAAMRRCPELATSMRHLWIMGGAFGVDETEHNFRSDSAAAAEVLASDAAITVTGLEVTRRVAIGDALLARIAQAGPLGAVLRDEIEQWWRFWDETWNVPHDPVTVLTLTQPELFAFSPLGRIEITRSEEFADDGRSVFVPGTGRTRLAVGIDADAVAERIVAAIVAASAAREATSASTGD